jgi:uncharacterized lipoprotein
MRTALLILAIVGLAGCSQSPGYVQQGYTPNAVQPVLNPSVAAAPGPPADLPSGAAHKVCVTAVNLC